MLSAAKSFRRISLRGVKKEYTFNLKNTLFNHFVVFSVFTQKALFFSNKTQHTDTFTKDIHFIS